MKAILAGFGILALAGMAQADVITIQLLNSAHPVVDANISPWNSYNDHNGSWMMGASGNLVGLMRFDLPALPGGSVVTSAKLQLYSSNNYNATGPVNATAHALLRNWDAADVNWQQYDAGQTWTTDGALGVGTDYEAATSGTISFVADAGYTDMDITTQYQQWFSGAEANYGLVIRPDAGNAGILYVGDAYGGANPVLVVNYTVPEPASLSLLGLGGLLALRRRG